jgi:hypothetical protein
MAERQSSCKSEEVAALGGVIVEAWRWNRQLDREVGSYCAGDTAMAAILGNVISKESFEWKVSLGNRSGKRYRIYSGGPAGLKTRDGARWDFFLLMQALDSLDAFLFPEVLATWSRSRYGMVRYCTAASYAYSYPLLRLAHGNPSSARPGWNRRRQSVR